jgi:hypothetical protein
MGMPLDATGGFDSSYDTSFSSTDGSDNSSNASTGNTSDFEQGDNQDFGTGSGGQTSEQACSGGQNPGTEDAGPPPDTTGSMEALIKAMAEAMGISEEEAAKKLESLGGGIPATQNSGAMFP